MLSLKKNQKAEVSAKEGSDERVSHSSHDKIKEYAAKVGRASGKAVIPHPGHIMGIGTAARTMAKIPRMAVNAVGYGVALPCYHFIFLPAVLLWKMMRKKTRHEVEFLQAESELTPFDEFFDDNISRKELKQKGERAVMLSKASIAISMAVLALFLIKWLAAGAGFYSVFSVACILMLTTGVALSNIGLYLRIYFSNNDAVSDNIALLVKEKRYNEIFPSSVRLNATLKEYAKVKKQLQDEIERNSNS